MQIPWRRLLLGNPLPSEAYVHQRLNKAKALAVFSSDALSSVAYAPQELLMILLLGGTAFMAFAPPVAAAVVVLLVVVVLSYRQLIKAYPSGGGDYEVARTNLGEKAGVVVASALLVDYVLTVAVSVSSGVDNIISALPALDRGTADLRIAVAGCYFRRDAAPEALEAVARLATALGVTGEVELPEAARARAAAYVISSAEGGALHLERLRTRAADFDPAVRDRLIAGAMLPACLVVRAQKLRRWYRAEVLKLFDSVDAILAPATPFTAPRIGQQTMALGGIEVPLRPNIGVFTQPISFIGLPVAVAPVPLKPLPIGVQIIAAPWREDVALRIAHTLEQAQAARAPRPGE